MTTYKQQWEKIMETWNMQTEPGRPNKEVVLIFYKFIKEKIKSGLVVVILGSTPEYRDLGYMLSKIYNAKIIAIDKSEKNYSAMTQLQAFPNEKEKFLCESWIKTSLPKNSVDIILGDCPFSNIPENLRASFFEEIQRMLKKNGLIISREDVIPNNFSKKINFQNELKKQAQKLLDGEITLREAASSFCESISRVCAIKNKDITHLDYFLKDFQIAFKKCEKSKNLIDKASFAILEISKQTYFSAPEKIWIIRKQKNFEREVNKFFQIQEKIVPTTMQYPDYFVIFIMTINTK